MISMIDFMKLENVKVIDVRDDMEYASGHIPNSIHIPLQDLEYRLGELNKEEVYYALCHSGSRSDFACQIANHKGYQFKNILGGIMSYKGALSYDV